MLRKRILSGLVLLAVIAACIYSKVFFDFTVLLFIIIGLYEFFTMIEKKGITPYKYFGIAMGVIIPLSIMFRFEVTRKWELLFVILSLLFLIVMLFKRRQNRGVIVDISTTLFGIFYISWFFSFLIKIRYFGAGGGWLFFSVLLITKFGDIGAYFIGRRFGKRPFIPRISPHKTVEGAIAGLVFSVIGALISRPILHFNYLYLVLLGIFLGILGQLGDLAESLIKRDCEVKDSGKILPGMGGILDEIDSLLFTIPVFYFYISIVLR